MAHLRAGGVRLEHAHVVVLADVPDPIMLFQAVAIRTRDAAHVGMRKQIRNEVTAGAKGGPTGSGSRHRTDVCGHQGREILNSRG